MNETQRAAAERLADDLQRFDGAERESLRDEAADLLRELLAEQWLTSAKLDACMASRDALRDWAQECRDQVLYLLAQRDDELGRLADGFGQASVALMRELLAEPVINQQMTTELAEPVQEPVAAELPAPQLLVESAQGFVEGWTRSQVRSAINLALLKRRYAAPQQPMRCPEDGGACGAGGYCRPEPQQRKPLSDEQINRLDTEAIHGGPDSQYAFRFARAVEKAHGITGEPT